jgi:apolipoprotein D and lipocalin family protein
MIIICFLLLVNSFTIAQNKEPVTVDHVDLQKYAGTWYEIAKIPNSFQDQCVGNTTATYSLNDDGSINVLNKCKDDEGEMDEAEGLAKVVDTKSNSKLEVSFVSIFGIHLFWGDYWIIGLPDDYSYVVIGTPNRKYGWILSRTPQLPEDKLNEAYDVLRENGYNPKDFVMTPQGI